MKKVFLVARYLLALMLLIFGLNKFIGFMEIPIPEGFGAQYMVAITGSYIWKTLGVIYLLCAVLLATNKAVGLATVLLAPIAFNILMYHLTLDIANIAAALLLTGLIVVVMIGNKDKYQSLLS